jgi:hypothetical protein
MPQASIDPVVMAAATVMRLQTIVSREIAAAEAAGQFAEMVFATGIVGTGLLAIPVLEGASYFERKRRLRHAVNSAHSWLNPRSLPNPY